MSQPLADTHIEVFIRILSDEALQRAFVRHELTVEALIQATLAEFTEEKELNENSDYALSMEGDILPDEATLAELNITQGAELTLGYVQFARSDTPRKDETDGGQGRTLVLTYEGTPRTDFTINTFPAIIGRPGLMGDTSPENLAADLSKFEEKGKRTVSRKHARLMLVSGKPAVQSINPNNPVYVMGQAVETGTERVLEAGDLLRCGQVNLRVSFE